MQAQLTLTNLKKHPNANGYILDLKMTQIESLWSIFERLKPSDISELILSYNSITTIEPAILKMKNLLTLNYSVNQIKNIANLDNLQRLESLNLSTNRINIINNLDSLKSLIRLDLSNNYLDTIECLPLFNLRFLNLSNNSLRKLENLGELVNLEYLNVSKNKISSLDCMEKIIIPSLKHLICSHNLFTSIYLEVLEPVLSNYKALEELDFVGNEIILNKAFVPKLSHLVSLKILNGVPVFRGTGTLKSQKKVFEKKKTDIKTESTEIIDYIEYNALKGVSLQDIFKSKEELPPTQENKNKTKTEDLMGMISNFSIQKSNEKFKKNEEALAKLKHYTGQHNPLVYQTNSQYLKKEDQSLTNSPEHNFISHSLKKSEETNPIYPTNNRSSPKSKRPSIFSLKNSEEALNKGKFQVNDAEKPLKQENNTVESSKINIKSISLEQDIDYLPSKVVKILPPKEGSSRKIAINPLESLKDIKNDANSLGSGPSFYDSKNSKNISSHSGFSIEEEKKKKKEYGSQGEINQRMKIRSTNRNVSYEKNLGNILNEKNYMNSSQNSKLSVNTDKLKERLEKFKENSRRNSESNKIIPLVDWKEKRKDFLYRKMKKMEEEAGDRLAEKKIKVTLKTNRCTIF